MSGNHNHYANVPIGGCECCKNYGYFEHVCSPVVNYERDKVEIICSDCQTVLSSFCREKEIDEKPIKADSALIGQSVKIKRFIAWVGYAKDKSTIFWTDENEHAEMVSLLAETMRVDPEVAERALLDDRNSWLERATRRRARYFMFQKVFKSEPALHNRSLWFCDREITIKIMGVVRCVTGWYYPGSGGASGYEWDEYEPPELHSQVHHQLFYGRNDDFGEWYLLYPGDLVDSAITE